MTPTPVLPSPQFGAETQQSRVAPGSVTNRPVLPPRGEQVGTPGDPTVTPLSDPTVTPNSGPTVIPHGDPMVTPQ